MFPLIQGFLIDSSFITPLHCLSFIAFAGVLYVYMFVCMCVLFIENFVLAYSYSVHFLAKFCLPGIKCTCILYSKTGFIDC